ncbi:pilus assembly protein TadG-related protein [Promicromonospora sp. NPDC057488]|uniref:pilus assembly protein TadG-related protein n=1 Tax=Promicromonospora sp. NPDC057488 TaxID=3346147 RepID=UPI00366A651C
MRLFRRPATDADERGSVSSWLVTSTFVMILGVGIAVDLTGQVHAQQHARDVAAQAARVGGQQLQGGAAIRGEGVRADPVQAVVAARNYLAAAGMSGTVSAPGGEVVLVRTDDIYETKFLSFIGLSNMPVSGEGEARIARAVGGTEQ